MNLDQLTALANKVESTAVDFIAMLGPWLGPLPSAFLVYRATINYLGWPSWIAFIAAAAVESIGVVSVVQALRLYEWNQTRTAKDSAAPFWFMVALSIFYLVTTIGLTVLLDVIPDLARYAPVVFPLLAIVGAANIAVKSDQKRREAARQERKQARQEVKAAARQDTRQESGNLPQAEMAAVGDFRQFKRSATREELLEIAAMETADIMATYRLDSPRTARNWRQNARQLTANGHANGAN
jgi:hypothetical protein